MINGISQLRSIQSNSAQSNSALFALESVLDVSSYLENNWSDKPWAERILSYLGLSHCRSEYKGDDRLLLDVLSILKPILPSSNEAGKVQASFSDGSRLTISVTKSELIEIAVTTPEGDEVSIFPERNKQDCLLKSLPVALHMPYIKKHHSLPEIEVNGADGMRFLCNFAAKLSTAIVPYSEKTNPLSGVSPLNSIYADTFRGLGNSDVSINGVSLSREAQQLLCHFIGLKDTGSSPPSNIINNGIDYDQAVILVSKSHVGEEQKALLTAVLCQPEFVAAICSSFYQSFTVPAFLLMHERIFLARQHFSEKSLVLPNAHFRINISNSSNGGLYVFNNVGTFIMAPGERGDVVGVFTMRTSYEIPLGTRCEIPELVRVIKPIYSASEAYSRN
ncbi:EspG domain-containing protein [Escherichia coli]|uniref:EspG domain-containing protein n=1 Tax=Escherichia coli TaxID=562 RepID=UPI000DFA8F7E|nr:EspG domain-containing protein [Escherichia coli]STN54272.1 T3SS secreted effector EspG-like protein [Escherichia coli]HAI2245356.1 secretion protein EspG [Escherichia coli]